ncbi:hypothetical protein KO493_09710 [Tamlana agarivorans]|uniref:Uncharacterized protein n=1 Tax=Pseudotamlana agarivorans TaxID=481183 RepID=A0ACC5U9P9_9FLAO|nr:hypothetical protein [Tamlana agarivorans]MBU2950974.1 hypothetical protein [Tamlana agarivorans]
MTKVFGGYIYLQNGNHMTLKDLEKKLASNQQTFDLIKTARLNNTIASIFEIAGGGLIGAPIGTTIAGGDANWALAGIGVGLIAIAIPIKLSSNKKANQAIELYNSSLNLTPFNKLKPELKLMANRNGLGLSINY